MHKLGLWICLASVCSAQSAKLAPGLSGLDANQTVDVIVRMKPAGAAARPALLRGQYRRSLDLIHSHVYSVRGSDLEALAADPNVESVEPDRSVRATSTSFVGGADYGWMTVLGLSSTTATLPYDGTGIGVAIVDSGIIDADDLKDAYGHNRIVYKTSFVPNDNNTDDHYGHGMHVAGIIGGNGHKSAGSNYSYTIRGIAPNVNIVSLRALDQHGSGTDSSVIAAIQAAISLKSKYNIRVLNLSLGRPVYESYKQDPLCQAVEQAWNAGIVVVVAAGNDGRDNSAGTNGYGTITAPGNDPYVITVGAMNTGGTLTRSDDKIASYSSKGPTALDHVVKPDLVAPGNLVVSTMGPPSRLRELYPQNLVTPTEYILSGTSMAAAIVSGAAVAVI